MVDYCEELFFDTPAINDSKEIEKNAYEILKLRYFINLPGGKKETSYHELCTRVAKVIASAEIDLNNNFGIEKSIYSDMMSHRFLFNSPALFSAGVGISSDPDISHFLYDNDTNYNMIRNNTNKNQMMFACFTINVDDSIEGIFNSVKNAAIISKYGGGVGANFGNLREKQSLIDGGCGGEASGPISFMETWNTMGSVVVQGGKRRAALMGMLYSNHPDIEEFIDAKTEDNKLSYFNISVAIDNLFMEAVENDLDYNLISPKTKRIVKTLKAKDLWNKICESAYKKGDPGIFFVDLANDDSLLKFNDDYIIETTNPCLTGDSLIKTSLTEYKRIDEIKVNDTVITYNLNNFTLEFSKVIKCGLTKQNANIIKLTLTNKKILKLTPEHKVYTDNRGYVEAKNLTIDDILVYIDKLAVLEYATLSSIEIIENADVYDITVEKNSNFFANGLLVHNCGEQPLPNNTSCNLGSINLVEFINKEDKKFNYHEFTKQIHRAVYYLDLVIDATQYPLQLIEKRTKNIRPIGLGIMGLADAAILLGYKYGSDEFKIFVKQIGSLLARESLFMSIELAKVKGAYPEYTNSTEKLILPEFVINDKGIIGCANEELAMEELYDTIMHNKLIPLSFKSALSSYYNKDSNKSDVYKLLFDLIQYGLRNSRRLSLAPTGTISMILNTSSSIEPNFAYEWTRSVTTTNNDKDVFTYKHRLSEYPKELLITARDLSITEHIETIKILAPYIDSAISKTVNLSNDATINDIKDIYNYCWKNNIKGITIYRDGSRNEQPIKHIEKLKEKTEIPVSIIKNRPKFMAGLTTKSDSPYGSIYLTANFDDTGSLFETFISAGKSGSVSKSVTEALSRVISLALRAGVKVEDITKTISNISGSEVWVYENVDNEEVLIKSIPDAVSKMLVDLNKIHINNCKNDFNSKIEYYTETKDEILNENDVCPECGAKMISISGCHLCLNCGSSPCK